MNRPKLGDLLVESNLIDEVQMKIALEEQKRRGGKFGSALISLHFIDENVLSAFLSKQLDIPCVSLTNIEISPKVIAKLTREIAFQYQAVPIRCDREKLYIAMADPLDMEAIEGLERHTDMVIVPMVAPQSSLGHVLKKYYPEAGRAKEEVAETAATAFPELIRELNDMDLFGRYFQQITDRLDRIEARLDDLKGLLLRE